MSRITQILKGKKVKPLTELESAVKYAVDHAGGGGGAAYVPFKIVEEEGKSPTVTTTADFAEVKTEYMAGKTLIAKLDVGEGVIVRMPLMSSVHDSDPDGFVFATVIDSAGSMENPKPQFVSIAFAATGVELSNANLAVET